MNRRLAELNTSAAHRERVFLEERLKSVKLELDDAARQFSQFASKNVTLDVPAQGKAMVEAAAQLQGEMIAAESQARGLEQIYTANNVRVRAARARVDELKRQLGELRGKTPGTQPAGSNQGFPSIRELPVLGVTYSDLYRRVKVEEAVFEALTKQYEMARVEEAKELPSVRLMDAPVVPERKAGPSRRLIVYLGTVISLFLGSVWVLGAALWQGTDQNILWKKLLLQAWDNVRQTTLYARCQRILARFRRKPATAAE
jgi:capsule polysaccharide export protein KpsE/RkpR